VDGPSEIDSGKVDAKVFVIGIEKYGAA